MFETVHAITISRGGTQAYQSQIWMKENIYHVNISCAQTLRTRIRVAEKHIPEPPM